MNAIRVSMLAVVCAIVSTPARASTYLSPFIGFNFGGDSANCISLTACEEKRANWGIVVGAAQGLIGFDEEIAYAPNFFGKTPGESNGVLTVMTNLTLNIPIRRVQPYALFGIGLIRPHVKFDATSLAVDKNALGYDVGGGVNIYFLPSVGVRGDLRHIRTFEGVTFSIFSGEKLDFWRASAGLSFRF